MGLVDYDKVASKYQAGRGPLADIEMCRSAVQGHLPSRPDGRLRVLDLGAGTGIFARVWPEWGATHVAAVDPTAAMLAEAVRVGLPAEASAVRGRAEAIPLSDGVVDVAWLSTVFHHFTGPEQAIAELSRVVVPGGVVFVRAFYSDLAPMSGWWDYFPGAHKAFERFRTLTELVELFEAGTFVFRIAEPTPQPPRLRDELVEWVRKMRDADSFLLGLPPGAVDAGLANLEATDKTTIDSGLLHIVVFERR
jgi:ubiquinone/menaquinone biosynthesis C-methylase UbiE